MSPGLKLIAIVGSALIVIVVVMVLFRPYFLARKLQPDNRGNYQRPASTSGSDIPQPAEPPEVYSYTGYVMSVDNAASRLIIQTSRGQKSVKYDLETEITSTTIPSESERRTLSTERILEQLDVQTTVKAAAISAGDMVMVTSQTNIREMSEFTASKIIIINY